MTLERYANNPILSPADVKPSRPDFEVIGVFNAGVARLGRETILLVRVAERPVSGNPNVYLCPMYNPDRGCLEVHSVNKRDVRYDFSDLRVIRGLGQTYLTSMSHIRVARSLDGYNFDVSDEPALFPDNHYEMYGIEDPRITEMENLFYITYSAISPVGITTCLALTENFVSFDRKGVIFHPDNKDVVIFPEVINGKYYALHRPSTSVFGKPDIWLAESADLMCWGNHRYVMGVREGYWDNGRIGASAVPFRTSRGWIELYHGASTDDRYCVGAVLLDADKPWRVLARSEEPFMLPEASYEMEGFFGNVVFPCGALQSGDIVRLYYGAADTHMSCADIPLSTILESMTTVYVT